MTLFDCRLCGWQGPDDEDGECPQCGDAIVSTALVLDARAHLPDPTSDAFIARRRDNEAKAAEYARAVRTCYSRKRQAAKLQRSPKWADDAAMRAIYEQCARQTIETGIPHEVDHEVPLRGMYVSGLHVEFNLRVVPRSVNRKKLNNFEI